MIITMNKKKPRTTKDEKGVKTIVINVISEQIGVNSGDIKVEDRLGTDLHMSASDISDLAEKLKEKDFDVDISDLNLQTTVNNLIEDLSF